MDEDTLAQLDTISAKMSEIIYSIRQPEDMLLDLDSTLLNNSSLVILGLLFHEDLTGYDIKKRIDGAISFF